MPRQRVTPDDFVRQVADTFKATKPTKRRQTQQTGDAGNQFGQKFVNPMDDVGQMISGGESGALEQVPAGTVGQVPTMTDVGGGVLKPRFATPSGGVTLPIAESDVTGLVSDLSTLTSAVAGKQASDATLTAIAAYNTNGILTQTAADTFTGRTITGTSDQVDVANGSGVAGNPTLSLPAAARTFTINFVIDGGGATITTGIKGDVMIDAACTITAWTALADIGGAIVVDIWGDVYGSYPPVVGDSITTSEKPTITATNTKGQDTSLNSGSGWAIAAGTILRFNVDSITTCQRVTIALKAVRS